MLVQGEVVAAPALVGAESTGQRPGVPQLRTPGLYASSLGGSSAGLHPHDTPRSMSHLHDTPRSMYESKETPRSMYASAESNLSSLSRLFPSGIGRSTPNQAARGTNGEGTGGVTGECVRALEGHEDAVSPSVGCAPGPVARKVPHSRDGCAPLARFIAATGLAPRAGGASCSRAQAMRRSECGTLTRGSGAACASSRNTPDPFGAAAGRQPTGADGGR
jgi:hypothetical protein